MSNLFLEFKEMIFHKTPPDEALLIPILIWSSGSEKNIEMCQRINRRVFGGNANIYIREVTLHNSVKHIIKYPKVTKDDDKTKFFYEDICSYYKWTGRELKKNINVLDMEETKNVIAKAFGYDNKQRKVIGLQGIKYGKKTKRKNISRNDGR